MDGGAYAWTLVDRTHWPKNLAPGDVCYFYCEYSPGRGRRYSQANTAVLDYKASHNEIQRDPSLADRKRDAISFYAAILGDFFETKRLKENDTPLSELGRQIGLVPIPPSDLPGSPDYDDRNVRTCALLHERYGFKLCRDVETVRHVVPAHKSSEPRSTERRYSSLGLASQDARNCNLVFVIDDVLASGEHYSAVRRLLRESGYGMFMCGMFTRPHTVAPPRTVRGSAVSPPDMLRHSRHHLPGLDTVSFHAQTLQSHVNGHLEFRVAYPAYALGKTL